MRTPYGKLVVLAALMITAFMLFMPMRSGTEDRLYAAPQSVSLHRGDTYAIKYRLEAHQAQAITFSSVNDSIARVSNRGVVTAVSAGSTDIHMLAENGARGLLHVEVVGDPATTLALSASELYLDKGQVSGLRAIFNDDATETLVTWRSADERVAKVDVQGRVTATGGGTTQITATTPSGLNASANVNVHVSGSAMHIRPDNLTVGVGTIMKLTPYYFPDDTTDTVARWTSSDPGVITVDDTGTMTAMGVGSATISAFSAGGLGGSTIITVESSADAFVLSPAAATVERGDVITLTPAFLTSDGQEDPASSSHYIQWDSSDPSVATVDGGTVKALRSGTTRITASADGTVAECELNVRVFVHEVTFSANSIFLLREQTVNPIQLTPTISPIDADNPVLTYASDNEMVATVSPGGLVTLTGGYGTAVITGTAEGGAQAQCTVNVVTELPKEVF